MSTIPNEYLTGAFDFGFTAVDDPESGQQVPTPPAPVVSTEEIAGPIIERIRNLEINLESALEILERLENAGAPNLDTDEYKALIEKDVREKLKKVEAMVMPLLVNLMKNPDKDYIKWPNRTPMIESFVEKLLAITRS